MPIEEDGVKCAKFTSGGKGNLGRFIERDKHICAAGVPSAQPNSSLKDCLQHYLLKDEVDALIGDAIIPSPSPKKLAPLRHPINPDQRHCGLNSQLTMLVSPPIKSKFQSFVKELKDTSYKSYWKTPLGRVPDVTPMLPDGYDVKNTTFGIKTPFHGRLYDIVLPKDPLPDKTQPYQLVAAHKCRNYCEPFDPDLTYGYRTNANDRGILVKCALTDERTVLGTAVFAPQSSIQAEFQDKKQPPIGKPINAYNDIHSGLPGLATKPSEPMVDVLSKFNRNPNVPFIRNCIKHLNKVRRFLSTRVLPTFYKPFYLSLKFLDKHKSGWIPKDIVYKHCRSNMITFEPSLIEPLLSLWEAFDGKNIEYKTFVDVLHFKRAIPDIPHIPDYHPDCLDFRTTYKEMVKPGQEIEDRGTAGLPSGYRSGLPHDSDMRACIEPSLMTLEHVSFRDMYAKREPAVIRKAFEAIGERFSEKRFDRVWEEAKKYHSQGWVCFETFRRALELLSET